MSSEAQMKNKSEEIKIIAKLDPNGVILTSNIIVYLDDEPVGALQDIKFHASSDNLVANLELTFPDLHSDKISKSYLTQPNLISTVDYYVNKFKSMLSVKIHLKDIFEDK